MGHHHHHHNGQNLRTAFLLNLFFTIIEFVGGVFVNSVAILSDAVHDLGDSLSLGLAWYLDKKSKKKASKNFTFGYSRLSLLGALINSVVLIAGSGFVIYEAVDRIMQPEMPNAEGMIAFAILGVLVNGYAAWKVSSGKSLNEKVVSWHLLEDVLGWVAVLVVAIILKFKYIPILDPALSLLIAAVILWGVVKRLKETMTIFLQGSPDDVDLEEITNSIKSVENVQSLHHTHVWSLDGEHHVFTTHIKLKNINSLSEVLSVKNEVKSIMKDYPFQHYTIETELDSETCGLELE
jgi:cobalt-zinc-cadmium efflux system protein